MSKRGLAELEMLFASVQPKTIGTHVGGEELSKPTPSRVRASRPQAAKSGKPMNRTQD
jgi:hypothetical protein